MPRRPTETWTPLIEPQGDICSFAVESEGDPGIYYMVDLAAYDGDGHCTCDDFTIRIEPLRTRDVKPTRNHCKHILRCYEYVGKEFTKKLVEKIKDGSLIRDKSIMKPIKSRRLYKRR